jgi:hypothetical protein
MGVFNQQEFDVMVEKGTKAWGDVNNINSWIENIRGYNTMDKLLELHNAAYAKATEQALLANAISDPEDSDIYTAAVNAYIEEFYLLSLAEFVGEEILAKIKSERV